MGNFQVSMQLNGAYIPSLKPSNRKQHGFFRAIAVPPVWITQEAHLDDRVRSLYTVSNLCSEAYSH